MRGVYEYLKEFGVELTSFRDAHVVISDVVTLSRKKEAQMSPNEQFKAHGRTARMKCPMFLLHFSFFFIRIYLGFCLIRFPDHILDDP